MKLIKLVLVAICVGLIMFGIVYRFILPFTSPKFDLLAWGAIGAAFLILFIMDRRGK